MPRYIALLALAVFALATPAVAGKNVPIIVSMHTSLADRTWVTVYRSELAGMKRDIVASGWISPGRSFVTHQYNKSHYFVRGQAHRGNDIIADTTVEFDPERNHTVTLVEVDRHFHWQVY